MKVLRKLPAMHFEYGIAPGFHRCRECCNLMQVADRGRMAYRCIAYGVSKTPATEWGLNYKACGKLNIPMVGEKPLLDRMLEVENGKKRT